MKAQTLERAMSANEILRFAKARGQRTLSEYDSKRVLADYGIPVCREDLAHSVDQAVFQAVRLGFPVAAKGCSHVLSHKTEGGWIQLDLRAEREVRTAYKRLSALAAGRIQLDGVLVQEMVPGSRELVMGLVRDPQFGPCVMLGLGGIYTELFQDTVFRMAPVDTADALDMVGELRSRDMLDEFRGQAAADVDAIVAALVALGRIGLEEEGVAEIDINPVKIDPRGRVVAVDALVVLQ
ncbi:MAG: acetate--CoA ligase family protein [Desulfatibacillaceae bacterium]